MPLILKGLKLPDTPAATIKKLGTQAKQAASAIAQSKTSQIDKALKDLSKIIIDNQNVILGANQKDIEGAKNKNLTPALMDRLTLTPDRLQAMAQSIKDIAALDDPTGIILEKTVRPNGLEIEKISVPIGVLGMIYESRPNVTIDAAALCLKSHNAVILRGGSESFHSSVSLYHCIIDALKKNDLPVHSVQMVPSPDRALVDEMLKASDTIDVIIPRGGKGLTRKVMAEAKMPVFAHLDGNCHIYVHHSVNPALALKIIENAKLRRTGICGAAESLIFDKNLDTKTMMEIVSMLLNQDCVIVGDETIQKLDPRVQPATEQDWSTEYLDKKISIKTIEYFDDVIKHINQYGSHHTDSILAEDGEVAKNFLSQIDSAIVMHNTSTQFADGGEFGMGAEIGIGTGKLHARGPVGLKQLVTFKYLVKGSGQIRP